MNKERILALADLVEKLPHEEEYYVPPREEGRDDHLPVVIGMEDWFFKNTVEKRASFNMRRYTNACGTPSCMAGWAIWMEGVERGDPKFLLKTQDSERPLKEIASEYLGIDSWEAWALFEPSVIDQGLTLSDLTPKTCAETLRRFAETGVIRFEQEA